MAPRFLPSPSSSQPMNPVSSAHPHTSCLSLGPPRCSPGNILVTIRIVHRRSECSLPIPADPGQVPKVSSPEKRPSQQVCRGASERVQKHCYPRNPWAWVFSSFLQTIIVDLFPTPFAAFPCTRVPYLPNSDPSPTASIIANHSPWRPPNNQPTSTPLPTMSRPTATLPPTSKSWTRPLEA